VTHEDRVFLLELLEACVEVSLGLRDRVAGAAAAGEHLADRGFCARGGFVSCFMDRPPSNCVMLARCAGSSLIAVNATGERGA
jgi:hypothetical protein